MRITTNAILALAVAGMGLTGVPARAQTASDSKMAMQDKMPMDKMTMDKMSKEDKAAMFDKMSESDKMAAAKMAGHDMAKMKSQDRMDMMQKLTMDEKAMMYEKMAMSKMKKGKMDKM